jgi:glycine cleavage system transcriptional repressor
MAKAFAVFSAIGADRVGIVEDLSGLIAERGGNIEESKMAVLGTEFAVMMLVAIEAGALERLHAELAGFEAKLGLKLGLKRTNEPAPALGGRPYRLETVSLDGFGLVHAVSAVLRRRGINIEDLETCTQAAPHTGTPMFLMKASVVLGPEVHVAELKRELEGLHLEQDLDVSLEPLLPQARSAG